MADETPTFAPVNGYCSRAAIDAAVSELSLGRLTNDQGDSPDLKVLSDIVTSVSRDMDKAFASAGYKVPITDTTTLAVIAPTCLDIVKFRLKDRRNSTPGEALTELYKAATRWLDRVAMRQVALPLTAEKERTATGDLRFGGVASINEETGIRWHV